MKSLVTLLLATTLILLPTAAKAQSEPPPVEQKSRLMGGVVLGVLVIATGMIVIAGLKKMCNKLPPLHSSTNTPPDISKGPILQSPSTNGNTVSLLESTTTGGWQEAYSFEFDDNMGLTVRKNGQVVPVTAETYVTASNGETMVYYDLRSLHIEKKPFAFFRLSEP